MCQEGCHSQISTKYLTGAGSELGTCLNPDRAGFYLQSQLGLGGERKVNCLEQFWGWGLTFRER